PGRGRRTNRPLTSPRGWLVVRSSVTDCENALLTTCATVRREFVRALSRERITGPDGGDRGQPERQRQRARHDPRRGRPRGRRLPGHGLAGRERQYEGQPGRPA